MNKETETAPDVKLSRRDANTVEQLKAAVASGEVSTRSALGQKCVRDLTEEEKLAHKACNQFVPEKAPNPKKDQAFFIGTHHPRREAPRNLRWIRQKNFGANYKENFRMLERSEIQR